jgi:hypothetical protein
MSTDEQDRLRLKELAGAVADERPVDWESELASSRHFASRLRQLRLIESISAAYRSVPTGDPGGATTGPGAGEPAHSPGATHPPGAGPSPEATREMPRRWGPLEIREWIGGGSFGEVYRAHDVRLRKDVALKLRSASRGASLTDDERFLNEARLLARVRHPNVLVVHGADRHDDRIGLWTDLVKGKTLEDELKQRGRYSGQEAALIAIDLCHALAAVHAAGLVHRDVKTANVMREEGGNIVLLDFSTVTERVVRPVDRLSDTMSGTPLFMAPESFAGIDSGARADVYSLGVLIYRLVTGGYPIEAENLAELVERHGEFRHRPLRDARPDLPAPLVAVVERAIHVDAERRFASMGEMEKALAAAIGLPGPEPTPIAPGAEPGSRAVSRRGRRATAWLAAAIVTVAAVFFGWKAIAPGPFEVDASLYKMTTSGPVALDQGGRIRPEDKLFVELEGSRAMYVYIVNEDRAGKETVLFPLEGVGLRNPLPPGTRHFLPGTDDEGQRTFWEVTSADGGDSILVLASPTRMPDIEAVFDRLAQAGDDLSPAGDEEDFAGRLRGIGGLAREQPGESSGVTRLMRSARRGEVWIWEWMLANP